MGILEKVECLYQIEQRVMKPKIKIPSKNGCDCSVCIYDPENNKKCIYYTPVKSYIFDVKENGQPKNREKDD
jgi:hypothetical protein